MENAVIAQTPARARTATLVAVGPADRLADVADVLGTADDAGALHIVRIGIDGTASSSPSQPDVTTMNGVRPEFVNNAIAAVRLSSLPTIVWWRGGQPDALDGVASLADRVILDLDDPWPSWTRTPPLFDVTALTDVRWAKLTRWRAALAHFFDLPAIRESASGFSSLSIAASDQPAAALFAGWLDSSFGWRGAVVPEFVDSTGAAPLEWVKLRGPQCELELQLLPKTTCLSTEGRIASDVVASRVVSLGSQTLAAFLAEELRVRSRDLAFERAIESALQARSTST